MWTRVRGVLPSGRSRGNWRPIFDQFTEEEQQKFYVALGCLVEVMHGGGSC